MERQYDLPTIMVTCLAVTMTIMYFIMPDATKQIFIVFTVYLMVSSSYMLAGSEKYSVYA